MNWESKTTLKNVCHDNMWYTYSLQYSSDKNTNLSKANPLCIQLYCIGMLLFFIHVIILNSFLQLLISQYTPCQEQCGALVKAIYQSRVIALENKSEKKKGRDRAVVAAQCVCGRRHELLLGAASFSTQHIRTSIQYMQVHVYTFTIPIHTCFLCHIIWIAVSLSGVVLRLPLLRPTALARYHAHWLHSPIPLPSYFLIFVISFLPFLHLFHPVTLFVTTFGCPSFTTRHAVSHLLFYIVSFWEDIP